MTSAPAEPPASTERLTMKEIAERVVALGYADTMTRQRIARLAKTDPAWPVPQAEWTRLGRYWQIPWDHRLDCYFAQRNSQPGPKGWPAQHDKHDKENRDAPEA